MKKKNVVLLSLFGVFTLLTVTSFSFLSKNNLFFVSADTTTLTLDDSNAPTNETTYQDSVVNYLNSFVTLTYTDVKASTDNHCALDWGGSIIKNQDSGDIQSITATFSGNLTLFTKYDSSENSWEKTYFLRSGVATAIEGNYFKIYANSPTSVTSIVMTYACTACADDPYNFLETMDQQTTYRLEAEDSSNTTGTITEVSATKYSNGTAITAVSGSSIYLPFKLSANSVISFDFAFANTTGAAATLASFNTCVRLDNSYYETPSSSSLDADGTVTSFNYGQTYITSGSHAFYIYFRNATIAFDYIDVTVMSYNCAKPSDLNITAGGMYEINPRSNYDKSMNMPNRDHINRANGHIESWTNSAATEGSSALTGECLGFTSFYEIPLRIQVSDGIDNIAFNLVLASTNSTTNMASESISYFSVNGERIDNSNFTETYLGSSATSTYHNWKNFYLGSYDSFSEGTYDLLLRLNAYGKDINFLKLSVFAYGDSLSFSTGTDLATIVKEDSTVYYVVKLMGDTSVSYNANDFALTDTLINGKVGSTMNVAASKVICDTENGFINVYFDISTVSRVSYDNKSINSWYHPQLSYGGISIGDDGYVKNSAYGISEEKIWTNNSEQHDTNNLYYGLYVENGIYGFVISASDIVLDNTTELGTLALKNSKMAYGVKTYLMDGASYEDSYFTVKGDNSDTLPFLTKEVNASTNAITLYFDLSSYQPASGSNPWIMSAHLYYNGSAFESVYKGNIMNMYKGDGYSGADGTYASINSAHNAVPMYIEGNSHTLTNGNITAKIIYKWSMFSIMMYNTAQTANPTIQSTTDLATFFNLYYTDPANKAGPALYVKFTLTSGTINPNTLTIKGDNGNNPITTVIGFDYVSSTSTIQLLYDLSSDLTTKGTNVYAHLYKNNSAYGYNGDSSGDMKTKGSVSTIGTLRGYRSAGGLTDINVLNCANGIWYELKEAWSMLVITTGS